MEKVHFQLAQAYRAAGHDVTVISRRFPGFSDSEIVNGVRYVRVASTDRSSSLPINLGLDFLYALRVARQLPPADITVTNSFSLPIVLSRRRAGKIYVHVARFPKHQMRLYFRADRLQAISDAVADEIIRQAPSLAPKVVSIGYPVPDPYYSAMPQGAKNRTILYVGRIAREKGVHLLVQAFARLVKSNAPGMADWALRIVGPHAIVQGGDGPEYIAELNRLAQSLGIACQFVGPLFGEQALIQEYQAASVFVYPSLAEKGEALGLAAQEAMAGGCATVVSNLRCFDDFIVDGQSGLKFDHRSSDPAGRLAERLAWLIADPSRVAAVAGLGRRAADNFRTPIIAKRMLDDFQLLLQATS